MGPLGLATAHGWVQPKPPLGQWWRRARPHFLPWIQAQGQCGGWPLFLQGHLVSRACSVPRTGLDFLTKMVPVAVGQLPCW